MAAARRAFSGAMSEVAHRRRRIRLSIAATIVGASMLSSCGGSSEATGATVVEVELGRFVIDPAVIEVPTGDVVLKVKNVDPDLPHNLVVYSKGTKTLAPGDSQTLEIPAVAVGEHRMWCDVQGHAQMGQVGALVVVPSAATSTT
jgi:uncharacterized cupredoxin-like copper-binding protein